MNNRGKLHKIRFLILTLSLIICTFSLPWTFSHAESQTIKIGILSMSGYASQNDDGTYAGSDVEFTYKIAQTADLNVEIVLYESGKEGLDALDRGEIDAMCNVIKTTDREEKYLFTAQEVGSLPLSIFGRNSDPEPETPGFDQYASMVFGVERDTKIKDYFEDWCTANKVTPTIKEFDSLSDIEWALDQKQIDAGVYGSPYVDGYRTLTTFSPQPYYYIFNKSNTALKDRFDDAMASILNQDPLYRSKLENKYANRLSHEMEALTLEEKKYILDHPNIKLAVLKNDQPYYAKDSAGNVSGIIPDFYDLLKEKLGLTFTYVEYASEEEAVNAVKNGEADVLAMYSDGQISAYNNGLRVTSPYANVDAVLVTHSGMTSSDIATIAVKKRTINAVEKGIGANLNATFIGYNNGTDCFTALKKGEVDGMICGQPSANWLINQSNVSSYSVTTISSGALEIDGALLYSNTTLCSLLSKGITSVSYNVNDLVTNNTLPPDGISATISRMSPSALLILSVVLGALVISLVWTMTLLLKHQKEKNAIMQMKAENAKKQIELAAAEKQTEEKNRFFSNISHDMRTPLNAIIGFSDVAAQEAISPKTKDCLDKIKSSGQLLNDLINDTLTISKVNSGKMVLQKRAVDTSEIFDVINYSIHEMAKQKGVKFTMDLSQCERRVIEVDPLNLEKILLNLLTNAVKYTPSGRTVELIAKIVPNGTDTPETIFIVQDTGIGISSQFLPHIYEPFVQEDNTGGESSGTGLGLSIVKNLVDLMDGRIEVTSEKNAGTKFTLHFHFKVIDQPLEEKAEIKEYADLAGKHILLCEDNRLNREIAVELLKKKGAVIDTAVNGKEGLQKYLGSEENYYDAVLMDVRMPVMNGLEATKAMRQAERSDAKTMPILAMTANAFEDDIKECLGAGMNAHIAKPIEPEIMFRAIAQAIKA